MRDDEGFTTDADADEKKKKSKGKKKIFFVGDFRHR